MASPPSPGAVLDSSRKRAAKKPSQHDEDSSPPSSPSTTSEGEVIEDEDPALQAFDGFKNNTDEPRDTEAAKDIHESRNNNTLNDSRDPDNPPETKRSNKSSAVPPLPTEPVPEDDGWSCQWDPQGRAWYFHNRFTGKAQWENPRVQLDDAAATTNATAISAPVVPATTAAVSTPPLPKEKPPAGGYNPAIHGDYDPNAWYAQRSPSPTVKVDVGDAGVGAEFPEGQPIPEPASEYAAGVSFSRFNGRPQAPGMGSERHSDEAKSQRQMNAYFDVDAAANLHDGRSLRAERSGKKPTKAELKQFREKRKAKKEEKRRAWLRD